MIGQSFEPVLNMVSTFCPWSSLFGSHTAAPASGAFESGNRALYFPLYIPTECQVKRMWWANGATVDAGYNIDAGVYRDAGFQPGAKIVSTGSTAQGTASQVQFVDVTDTWLTPALYWLAISCSSTSATFLRAAPLNLTDAWFKMIEASALPLPATATPSEATSNAVLLFGFSTTTIT